MDEMAEIVAMLPQPTGADFGWPGWEYRDVPRLTPAAMEKLIDIIGDGNYRFVTIAEYVSGGERSVRGQMLISPAGMERMSAWQVERA